MSKSRTKKGGGSSGTEVILSVTFVLCAIAAAFIVMHKEELMAGNIDQVVESYLEKAPQSE